MSSTDIVAYTFRADTYCPDCIGEVVTGLPEFDGWQLGDGIRLSPEDNLNEIAAAFSIDREDERSFDSNDFPKVVFESNLLEEFEFCGRCRRLIGD